MGIRLRKIWRNLKGVVFQTLLTISIVASLRIFLFASFTIPTFSMQPTVLPGDHVLVNKLVPGPRLDWLLQGEEVRDYSRYRVKGYRAVVRGDVLVFNAPYHRSSSIERNPDVYYIKRCLGVPGDTLVINDGTYQLKNGMASSSWSHPIDHSIDDAWMDTHRPELFKALGWTLTSFGPVYIPYKGSKIRLDSVNIHLYRNLIEYETGREVSFSNNVCYLDHIPYPRHTFKQNYYFMAGDFPVDSEDSRFWGLLPEDHIVGKAAYIWMSVDPSTRKHRFNRFLKAID